MLCNEFSREEMEKRNNGKSECHPIETCIERNAKHGTREWENCTQNRLIERIWEKQDDE